MGRLIVFLIFATLATICWLAVANVIESTEVGKGFAGLFGMTFTLLTVAVIIS